MDLDSQNSDTGMKPPKEPLTASGLVVQRKETKREVQEKQTTKVLEDLEQLGPDQMAQWYFNAYLVDVIFS